MLELFFWDLLKIIFQNPRPVPQTKSVTPRKKKKRNLKHTAFHKTLAIPQSVSGSKYNFEVSFVALPGGLDIALLLLRFGERWN